MNRQWMCVIIGLGLAACGEPNTSQTVSQEDLNEKAEEIQAMIGDASCADVSSCASVAFGAKPCGGPWEYLVYCVDSVDEAALKQSVDEYFELEQQYNEENGMSSDCAMEGEPQLDLVDGVCTTLPNG